MSAEFAEPATEFQKTHRIATLLDEHRGELEELKTQFAGREDDEILLFRFLAGMHWNMDDAKARLEKNLEWREKVDFKGILEKYGDEGIKQEDLPFGKAVNRWWPHCEDYCRDRSGNQVAIVRIGQIDFKGLTTNVSIDEMREYMRVLSIRVVLENQKTSRKTGYLAKCVRIIDLEGLSSSHIQHLLLDYLRTSMDADFPENMWKTFIVNSPTIFTMAWKVVQTFLDARTKAKVKILGSQFHKEIEPFIDIEQLPECLGGKNLKPCSTDYEKDFQTETVSAGSSFVSEIEVSAEGDIVQWEFRVIQYDIQFKIEFKDESGSIKPLKAITTVALDDGVQSGEVLAPGKGVVLFTFDNTHASWYSKTVKFLVNKQ